MVLVNKVIKKFGQDLSEFTFGIWGLAFKPSTDDVREASSLIIISELVKRGAKVRVYDPQAAENFKEFIKDYLSKE